MSLLTNTEPAYIKRNPIVVDLDGTLINTDLLHEGFILLLKKNLLYIFSCFFWLTKGRAYLKHKILSKVEIACHLLPFNKDVLNFLQEEYKKGTTLILATASPLSIALEVAKVYPIFDKVYGSDELINLKGKQKLKVLVDEFGVSNFDYIGNSHADLVLFKASGESYLVNPGRLLKRKASKIANLKIIGEAQKTNLINYLKAIRIHQWVKNLLLFVPLVTSHSFYSPYPFYRAILGFIAFSFIASAGYLINDLLDLKSDRSHPKKQFRPLANGKISILSGLIMALVLFATSLIIAAYLSLSFLVVLVFYFIMSFSYSIYFKKMVLYDVFILASLYSLRIIAGGVVTHIPLSFWLISFSIFIFLSLAFVKRYSELMKITHETGLINRGREYFKNDLALLQMMGIVSGFMSIIVFSLYIDSSEVKELYSKPKILWLISLLILFWISRIWLITNRGKMNDDPIIFAIKDKASYLICAAIGIIIFISKSVQF